jgi:tRNA pseudouridine38-40 synthase
MRIALGLEYDGTRYLGWQSQPGGRTVQDVLEQAIGAIAGEPVRVACAGRTDTGVHARGQVVHFDTPADRPDGAWVKGVNTHLPSDIAVQWSARVPEAFHARFAAQSRRYDYVLLNRPVRSALDATTMGWFHAPLDLARMRAAATHLLGEHDFSAFRSAECQAKSPIRLLRRLDIHRHGDVFQFTLEANAFLHHMVRNIVGCLVYVGKGKHSPEWLAELLAQRSRALAAPTFSPCGLYLSRVHYDAGWALPAFPTVPSLSQATCTEPG